MGAFNSLPNPPPLCTWAALAPLCLYSLCLSGHLHLCPHPTPQCARFFLSHHMPALPPHPCPASQQPRRHPLRHQAPGARSPRPPLKPRVWLHTRLSGRPRCRRSSSRAAVPSHRTQRPCHEDHAWPKTAAHNTRPCLAALLEDSGGCRLDTPPCQPSNTHTAASGAALKRSCPQHMARRNPCGAPSAPDVAALGAPPRAAPALFLCVARRPQSGRSRAPREPP